MELNIFNGDCAYEAWRKFNGDAEALVWRENYLEGRIPGKDTPPAEFERIRAEELHRLMPELDYEKLLAYLRKMDRTVSGLTANDAAFLWFDACMYDQLMLSRILSLLKNTEASIFLVCENVAWGDDPTLFATKRAEARLLTPDDIALFASAWDAVSEGRQPLEQLLTAKKTEYFPFLSKALARYLEEFPGTDGLGRTERQLLEIIRSGKHSEDEIFRAVGNYEEYPFMGDTMCRHLLEGLSKRRLLSIQPDGQYHLEAE